MLNWLIIFSLYLPFQLALNPVEGIDLASIRIFILVLFFSYLAEGLKNKKIFIENGWQAGLIASFLFLNFISLFFAQNQDWSARKILYLFSTFPIYFVFSSISGQKEKIIKIIKALVASGAVASILGIFQFFLQFIVGVKSVFSLWANYVVPPFLGKSFSEAVISNPSWLVNISGKTYFRATATFPDPHMFSFFLGMLLPFSIGLFLNSRKKIWFFSSLVIFLADALTFSRGGYMGLAAGLAFLLFVFWGKIQKKYKIAVFSAIAVVILAIFIPSPISSRFFSSFDLSDRSNLGRIEMWRKALAVSADNFWLGAGIGNFPLKVDPLADYRNSIYAHNTYLDISSETGAPAALIWIILLCYSVAGFLKKSKNDMLFLSGALSLVIFSTHSLVETGIYSPVVLALFLIIISFSKKNEKTV